jgi:glycosyltransferase involved in cell wall biosynthesis
MRVLHVASGDLWAGAEVQIYLLVTELAKLPEMQIQVALMNDGELARRLRLAGVNVEVIDESRLGALAIVSALRKLMTRLQPQVVHTHRIKENLLGLLANALSARAPMVRTSHGANEHAADWSRPAQRILQGMDDLCGRYLTRHVIAVSSALGVAMRDTHGYRNISVVLNGIDVAAIAASQTPAPFATPDSGVRHIGLAGRLEPVKRGDLFLQMAAELVARGLSYGLRFHVFGDGSQRTSLEELSARLGLDAHVQFHGHTPQAVSWLGCLDALVLCSDHEGLPMILLEAMAAGTPVVAHAVGGIGEVMQGDVGGTLVTRHAATAYADAVARILSGETPVDRDAARARLLAKYSAEKAARATAALYLNCTQRDLTDARVSH